MRPSSPTMSRRSSAEKRRIMPSTRSREQRQSSCTALRLEDAHAALVEQPVEQALARQRRVDQFVILDRLDQRPGLDPGIVLAGRHRGRRELMALRHVARVRGRPARRRSGECRQELDHQAAGPLGAGRLLELLRHREAHPRRDLLGLAEILVRRLLEALALERDDALVAAALRSPGRWSWRDDPGRAARRSRCVPLPMASSLSASKRAVARRRSGASKSTTIIVDRRRRVLVWSWKRPSNLSDEPSRTVSAAASPSTRETASG